MTLELLRAVGPGAGVRKRITGPLSSALQRVRGLAPVVNVRVGAAVSGRSGALGEVLRGAPNLSPGGEAVAGSRGFIGNLASHQEGESVAAGRRTGIST